MPNVSTEYYETLSEIENILVADKSGLRILVDEAGFANLKNDPDSKELIKFSIVCIKKEGEPEIGSSIEGPPFSVVDLNGILRHKGCTSYMEQSWQAPVTNQMLFLSVSDVELEKLSSKVTLLPFSISTASMKEVARINKTYKFFDKGDDPKTGVTYLHRINEIFNQKLHFKERNLEPVVSFFGYSREAPFNLRVRYYPPRNFKALTNSLVEKPKMILTGYGMGNNHTAIKLLQNISLSRPNKRIFEIRVYAREELNRFIDDYEAGSLACASVVLRDFFDPFTKGYRKEDDCNLFAHEFIEEIERIKDSENLKTIDPKSIPSQEIQKRMLEDKAFEKLFRQEQIFESFDGTCGNYLIITSQFDTDITIEKFYKTHLSNLEIGTKILKELSNFIVRDLIYENKKNIHNLFTAELFSEVELRLVDKLDADTQIKLTNSLDNLISFFNNNESSEPFRIGMAIVFKTMLFQGLETFLAKKEFEGDLKRVFVENFVKEVADMKRDYDHYFQFLH